MRTRMRSGLLIALVLTCLLASVARADPDDGTQIDVLVLISQNARAIAGGTDLQAVTIVDDAFVDVNQAYSTAGVNTHIRIVGYVPVFYLEQINGDPDADLDSLTGTADGILDEIHALRDAYAADLVVLVAGSWFAIYDGNGHPVPPFDDALGFMVLEMRAIQTDAPLKWTTRALGVDALPPFTLPQIDALNTNRVAVANYRAADSRTIGPAELAINGGFELDADADNVPDFWAAKNWSTGDKRTCNAPAGSNGCVVKLKPAAANKELKTKVVSPPVMLMDSVMGSVRAITSEQACVTVKLVVKGGDAGDSRATTTLCFIAADGWQTVSATAQAAAAVDKIKMTIKVTGQGKTWLDDASILTTPYATLRGVR